MCGIVIHSQNVPSIGGIILFDIIVTNVGYSSIPVYAEIYPTVGDCATGTPFDFDINRLMTQNLPEDSTYVGQYFYVPGNVSGLGLSTAAINVDVGPAIDDWLSSCCDEFMFYNPWNRTGSSTVTWNTEFFERGDKDFNLPIATSLGQNYPNPFNATTTIPFDLVEAGNVSLKIYNISGRLIDIVMDEYLTAGKHTVKWDGTKYSSGVYFCKLSTGDEIKTMRMILLK